MEEGKESRKGKKERKISIGFRRWVFN